MTDIVEKISIERLEEKKFKVRMFEAKPEGQAALTHFAHNSKNGVAKYYKQEAKEFAEKVVEYQVGPDTTSIAAEEALQTLLFQYDKKDIPFPSPEKPKFKFIDLFAGIGGFRIAMQDLGGKCVFTSEWDEAAKKTYEANFGERPFGDITKEFTKSFIPDDFDVLCAGFPCQAFSIAGRRGGFNDTRGTLFFDVAEIIRRKKPKALFLENVKGLRNHDKGKTLSTILNVLRNDLGYYVPEPQIINAKDFGVPQNRERIFIVGFRKDLKIDEFEYPKPLNIDVSFEDVKEDKEVSVKYYLSTKYLETLRAHKQRHESKGNGFGYSIINADNEGIANAIVVGGMGRERNLVYDCRLSDFTPITHIKGEVNREGIRKMTPREWARLQGFPDKFKIPVADASAYKQFGNSVAVPAIKATARKIINKVIG
jgi:DNA (cytosine-5)-methyltransferase 1